MSIGITQVVFWLCWLSVITFATYWFDKRQAVKDGWRVRENTLHLLAVLGGWLGALIAQQQLRHKSIKQSFRRIFWLTVVVNCASIATLLLY